MPLATASRGDRMVTVLPWTRISPESCGSAPNTARMTSVRPAPTRPATPRISPLRSWKLTSRITRPRLRLRTSRTTSWLGFSGRSGASSKIVRPTIIAMMSWIPTSAVMTVSMNRPSRMTVTRSEIFLSSSRRCEMCTMPWPRSRRWRVMRKSSSISVSVRAAVGSSMIRTSGLYENALAISTICCWATARLETRARGSRWMWSSSNSSSALRFSAFSLRTNPRRGSRPMKMFWATVRWPARLSSWWMIAIPRSWAALGLAISTSSPLTRMEPPSRL